MSDAARFRSTPRRAGLAAAVVAVTLVSAAAHADHHMSGPHAGTAGAMATLHDAAGNAVGTLMLQPGSDGDLMVMGDLKGLAPGEHGFHIHEKGLCEAPFTSAGGHFNPGGKQHGRDNPMGAHAGDLSNLTVAADGTASVHVMLHGVSLTGDGGQPALLDADGSAFVIHEKADDNRSDPAGNAGPRVACGVIVAR